MDTSFERKEGKEDWLTPPPIIKALGHFDLDPCAAINQPWRTADTQYTIIDNGLSRPWFGRVWNNPPYGTKTGQFMERLKLHGNGIALIFARTETQTWFKHIWYNAHAIYFIKGRIKFFTKEGIESDSAGAPSALIAYGEGNVLALQAQKSIPGKLVRLR